MVDKKTEKIFPIIDQPLEGLLYDLDLLPEQCRTEINNIRRLAVEGLYKKVEVLRRKVEV